MKICIPIEGLETTRMSSRDVAANALLAVFLFLVLMPMGFTPFTASVFLNALWASACHDMGFRPLRKWRHGVFCLGVSCVLILTCFGPTLISII
ncbi:hypothetical protein ABIC83_002833 [Roseateles asaccharophilus]|uniref:hypothetical protein n=1 Tax=Roseateles asaccharophilus TaxID=582607 RepID=UPI0038332A56